MIKILSKNVMFPNGIRSGCVCTDNNVITYAQEKDEQVFCKQTLDAGEDFVFPGLIDIHSHGSLGIDFCEATPEETVKAVNYHMTHGVTSIMPTVTSSSYEKTYEALENLESACKLSSNIIGAHLEGPYFSPKQCGAQDKTFITAPDKKNYERLAERFKTLIKR